MYIFGHPGDKRKLKSVPESVGEVDKGELALVISCLNSMTESASENAMKY